jgi:GNAT superfamily N-acetyltransferase
VGAGKAHAALVFHGDIAVAWCEYGSPEELPSIYHLKEYTAGLERLPDDRITCSFVDKGYRRKGVAAVALHRALDLISQAGGGVVEAYPQDMQGKKPLRPSFTTEPATFFEQAGFEYQRPRGKNHCVMRLTVPPS